MRAARVWSGGGRSFWAPTYETSSQPDAARRSHPPGQVVNRCAFTVGVSSPACRVRGRAHWTSQRITRDAGRLRTPTDATARRGCSVASRPGTPRGSRLIRDLVRLPFMEHAPGVMDGSRGDPAVSAVAPSPGVVGMWAFIGTDIMGFGGLLLAFAVLRMRAPVWPDPADRHDRLLALGLTIVLVLSAAAAVALVGALRARRLGAARVWWTLTIVLGLGFIAGQAGEYASLVGSRKLGLTADHAAAMFYVLTGYHGVHVLAGLVAFVLLFPRRARLDDHVALRPAIGRAEVAVLYWHFVDVVWLILFPLLYLLPPVGHG